MDRFFVFPLGFFGFLLRFFGFALFDLGDRFFGRRLSTRLPLSQARALAELLPGSDAERKAIAPGGATSGSFSVRLRCRFGAAFGSRGIGRGRRLTLAAQVADQCQQGSDRDEGDQPWSRAFHRRRFHRFEGRSMVSALGNDSSASAKALMYALLKAGAKACR